MFCHNCGHKQNDDAKFCHECGSPLLSLRQEKIVIDHTHKFSKWLIPLLVSLFFIAWAVYYFKTDSAADSSNINNLSKVSVSNTTTIKLSEKPPFSKDDGEKIIYKYFNLLDFKEYKKAFDLFSDNLQGQIKYEIWEKGYSNTLSHLINKVDCIDFICEIDLVATENTNKNLQKTKYKFKYSLVYNKNNELKIDKSVFISSDIKEVIKSYDTSVNNDSKLLESFVKVICTDPLFEEFSQGSGTVINDDIVLTNFHVSLGYPEYCFVKHVDEQGQITYDSFLIDKSIIENQYNDFWVFHIKPAEDNIFEAPKKLSIKACSKEQIHIGDSVRIYGFPGVGGDNLTITDGLVSGVDSRVEGLYITSAKIDHGNSGGTAIDIAKNCFLGIPTIGLHGELESYGGILDINKILEIEPNIFSIKK